MGAVAVRNSHSPKFEVSDKQDEKAATPMTDGEFQPSAKQAVRKSRVATAFPKAGVSKEGSREKALEDGEKPKEKVKIKRKKSKYDEEAKKKKKKKKKKGGKKKKKKKKKKS